MVVGRGGTAVALGRPAVGLGVVATVPGGTDADALSGVAEGKNAVAVGVEAEPIGAPATLSRRCRVPLLPAAPAM